MHARQSQPHTGEKSRALQRGLYRAAKRSGTRRFHALYDRIVRPDVLWRAWLEVRANRGRAGVDGVRIEDVERRGAAAYLEALAAELKAGVYRPQPVLRVEMPKPDGRTRPLGIPTVRDRVVQQACKIVIEPLFEASFLPCSYGYRPKRSAGQAVLAVKAALVRRWWVVEADIEGFFTHVDHEILRGLVRRRISDRRVLTLIDQWLRAGVIVDGQRQATRCGVPQGGVMSPLLANIYLHTLCDQLDLAEFYGCPDGAVWRRAAGRLGSTSPTSLRGRVPARVHDPRRRAAIGHRPDTIPVGRRRSTQRGGCRPSCRGAHATRVLTNAAAVGPSALAR